MRGLIDTDTIVGRANLVVCTYALAEEKRTRIKAKKCGCRICLTEAKDAEERVAWVAEAYTVKRRVRA